jgi:hypothetical protein
VQPQQQQQQQCQRRVADEAAPDCRTPSCSPSSSTSSSLLLFSWTCLDDPAADRERSSLFQHGHRQLDVIIKSKTIIFFPTSFIYYLLEEKNASAFGL